MNKILLFALRIITVIAVVLILIAEKRYIIVFNNTDSYESLITSRYSVDELNNYDRYVVRSNGYPTLASFIARFNVECARRVSDNEGYIILLDEENEAWFFVYKVNVDGYTDGKPRIYNVVRKAVFYSVDELIERDLFDVPVERPSELGVCLFMRSSNLVGPCFSTYVKEGLLVFNGTSYDEIENQNEYSEILFIPNEKLRETNAVDFYQYYIFDIDRQ